MGLAVPEIAKFDESPVPHLANDRVDRFHTASVAFRQVASRPRVSEKIAAAVGAA